MFANMFIEIIDVIAVFCMHCTVIIVVCIVTGKQLNLPTCFICRHAVTIYYVTMTVQFFSMFTLDIILYIEKKNKNRTTTYYGKYFHNKSEN